MISLKAQGGYMETNYDEVYELVEKFTSENIRDMAQWVISKKYTWNVNEEERNRSKCLNYIKLLIKKFEVNQELSRKEFWNELSEFYKNNIKIYKEYVEIGYDIRNRDIEDLKKDIKKYIDCLPGDINNEYDYDDLLKSYICDPELLISGVIEILNIDYHDKIKKTKIAIAKYIDPHKLALTKLMTEINKIETGLNHLNEDTNISTIDKKEIENALREKLNELSIMKSNELDNMRNVKAFVEEIRISQQKFSSVIEALEKKNNEARSRKDYMALIKSIDASIPKLQNIFHELSIQLSNDMDNIRNAMYLLNMSVKEDLLKSFEDQNIITGILGSTAGGVVERICSTRDRLKNKDEEIYDIDLEFLNISS